MSNETTPMTLSIGNQESLLMWFTFKNQIIVFSFLKEASMKLMMLAQQTADTVGEVAGNMVATGSGNFGALNFLANACTIALLVLFVLNIMKVLPIHTKTL